jgi:glycosyltransferase involved in cell wall biosynthesis
MMRLVKVISARDVFGPEKTVIEECRVLGARGWDCLLVNLWDDEDIPLTGKVAAAGVPYLRLPSRWKFDWRAVGTLRDLLRVSPLTVVHAHGFKADVYVLWAGRQAGVPIVSTVHGWTSENLKVRAYEWLQERLWRYYDRVICVSDSYRKVAARAGVSAERLTVIRNGIRAAYDVGDAGGTARAEARRRLGLQDGELAVAIIGRLSVEKGHLRFVEAAQSVREHVPAARFLIIGEGPERPRIEAAIAQRGLTGVVRLLGHRDDVRELYPGLDLLAITSDREGLPNVLLEAMLGSVPAVCANVGGIPEVVRDGVDGLLVPPGDVAALASALSSLLSDPARRAAFGRAARARIQEDFLFDARMDKVATLYDDVARTARA